MISIQILTELLICLEAGWVCKSVYEEAIIGLTVVALTIHQIIRKEKARRSKSLSKDGMT